MESVQNILRDYNYGEKSDFLFFWGHQPSKTGEITKSCLSQWWMADFVDPRDQSKYCCAEQFMMAQKAEIFKDFETKKAIMANRNPKEIKSLGRHVRGFDQRAWDEYKHFIVFYGNQLKFSQNPELKEFLISTGNKVIVEASPYDKVWGIGMDANNPKATNPNLWNGENLLGFALMIVRDFFRLNT